MNLFSSLNVTIVLLIGVWTLVLFILKRIYSYWDRRGFKTLPDYYYLTGHLKLDLGRKAFANIALRLYDCYEPFIGIFFLFSPKLLVRDPELIRTILIKDFSYFTDRGVLANEELEPLSGHLFALPGQKWRNLRAKLSPTFSSGKLKAMFPTIMECGLTLQEYLAKFTAKENSLDIAEISARFTINVIASVAFGIDVDTINNPNNEFLACGLSVTRPSFLIGLKRLLIVFAPKLATSLKLRFDDLNVEHFIISLVTQNLEYREKNNIVRKDFFQLLIQLRNSGSVQLDDEWETTIESEKKMTIPEMAAQAFIFLIAGFETSSSTTSFCLYELARNPDIQQRVHDEIDQVLAQHNGQITYKSVSEMKFLECCIEETLRLYPFLPFLSRMCNQDYRIPGTDSVIEKGVEVIIPVISLHRDEKYYNEPNKFHPDRFNGENSAGKDQINQPYYPFGDGPRICIGMRLGRMQTKIGIVLMLQNYKYELDDGLKNREVEFDPKVFLISALGGIKLKIIKR